ncbi:MAG: glycosyltransferase family 2 protein [Gemmatimonadales bacterium]
MTTATAPNPLVTVIMPIRNEEAFLGRCLDSVAAGDFPLDQLEVLILDGDSTDRSVGIAESYRNRIPGLKVIPNPARIQSAAFNLALGAARGEFVVRMDAHTIYAPDYVSRCVHLLRTSGAANVGGPQRSVGETALTKAIACAVSSRFGAGDASSRYAQEDVWADTVYLGSWRTETLRRLGGMRAEWAVNEDYEMNYRLRQAGGKILVSPSIKSSYFVRGSIPKLARQYFRYGFWKVRTLLAHPASLRWRQMVAPGLAGYLLTLVVTVPVFGWPALLPLGAYLAGLGVAVSVGAREPGVPWWYLPAIYPVIHLSYGSGFLLGWFRWLPERSRDRRNAPVSTPADRSDGSAPDPAAPSSA